MLDNKPNQLHPQGIKIEGSKVISQDFISTGAWIRT